MSPQLLRLALTIEFMVAVVTIFETWSMAGGQGHLDLMPWYTKLGFVLGLALVSVLATASAMAHERAWNAKTVACLILALMIAAGMGATTYYYHLHENDEAQGDEDNSLTFSHGSRVPLLKLGWRK